MFNISQFLDKFSKLRSNAVVVRTTVIETLKENLNLTVSEKDIQVKEGIVYIQANPLIKNMLNTKKPALLEALTKKGLEIRDIR